MRTEDQSVIGFSLTWFKFQHYICCKIWGALEMLWKLLSSPLFLSSDIVKAKGYFTILGRLLVTNMKYMV